jgi:hypothetical protein
MGRPKCSRFCGASQIGFALLLGYMFLHPSTASAQLLGFGWDGSSSQRRLAQIDPLTGQTTFSGPGYSFGMLPTAYALDPSSHTYFIDDNYNGRLLEIDTTTGSLLRQVSLTEMDDLEFDPVGGELYGFGWDGGTSQRRLAQIDPLTGQTTFSGPGYSFGTLPTAYALDPSSHTYFIDDNYNGQLLEIDTNSGALLRQVGITEMDDLEAVPEPATSAPTILLSLNLIWRRRRIGQRSETVR